MYRQINLLILLLYSTAVVLAQDYIKGELDNGLRYVVRRNDKPSSRINFQLIMSVGSVNENKKEKAVAHYLEHLAFENTKNYPKGKIVSILESKGEKYGITINAYTGYDRTVYMFSLPSADKENITLGIDILNEWLTNIDPRKEFVDRERPIIVEEIRTNFSPMSPEDKLLKGACWQMNRLPVGEVYEVEKVDSASILSFYKRNYRPENASILIIGGGIEPETVEKLVKDKFSSLKGDRRKRKMMGEIVYDFTKSVLMEKGEKAEIEFIYPLKLKSSSSYKGVVEEKKNDFLYRMIRKHLAAKGIKVHLTKNWFLGRTEHLRLTASANTFEEARDMIYKAVAAINGMAEYGFTKGEISNAVDYMEENKDNYSYASTSSDLCDFYQDILLTDTRNVKDALEAARVRDDIKASSSEEWKVMAKELVGILKGKYILRCVYESEKPNEKALKYGYKQALKKIDHEKPLYKLDDKDKDNMSKINDFFLDDLGAYDAKKIVKYQHRKMNVDEYVLPNSARLVVKHTDNADSTILVNLIYPGGLSLIPKKNFPQFEGVAAYMSLGGVEGISNDEYNDLLYKKKMAVIPTIENNYHGILASGSNAQEIANLIYMRIAKPTLEYDDFKEIISEEIDNWQEKKRKTKDMRTMISCDPLRKMRNRMDVLMSNIIPYTREATLSEWKKMNLDSIYSLYKDIYTNSNGLICVVVGNIDVQKVAPYFLSLLSKFSKRDLRIEPAMPSSLPKSKKIEKVATGQKGRLVFEDIYRAEYTPSLKANLTLKIMRDVLRKRLIDILRNDNGLIYSPYVDLSFHSKPYPAFCLDVNGEVDSRNASMVRKLIKKEVEKIKKEGVDRDEVDNIKKSFVLTRRQNLLPDASIEWRDYIVRTIKGGESLDDADNYEEVLNSITIDDIRRMFVEKMNDNTYLYIGNYEDKED